MGLTDVNCRDKDGTGVNVAVGRGVKVQVGGMGVAVGGAGKGVFVAVGAKGVGDGIAAVGVQVGMVTKVDVAVGDGCAKRVAADVGEGEGTLPTFCDVRDSDNWASACWPFAEAWRNAV